MPATRTAPSTIGVDASVGLWLDRTLGTFSALEGLDVHPRKAARGQSVTRVEDGEGRTWILKRAGQRDEWRAEDRAYRHWVPAMRDRAPTMLASDADLLTLLVGELTGRRADPRDRSTSRRAGRALRGLHDAVPPRPEPDRAREHTAERVARLLHRSAEVWTPRDTSFLREQHARLQRLPRGMQVPCHGDYGAHNWVVDHDGTLRIIDFGTSRWQVPAWDLAKLFMRPWWGRPRLASAFLRGYGRLLTPAEAEFVEARLAIDALAHATFGYVRGSERHVRFARARIDALQAGECPVLPRMVA
jgi:Ser/Thr protein kinase RdoA (MazF antagonist)